MLQAENDREFRTGDIEPRVIFGGTMPTAEVIRTEIAPDPSRFARTFREHCDFVFRSCRRLGLDAASAEDATQQVFLVASRKLGDVPVGKERAFLFVTASNVSANMRRTLRRRREDFVELDSPDPSVPIDKRLDEARARAIADHILDEMEEELRIAFILAELEQVTFTEMAELLSIPRGTVASRVRRAKEDFDARVKRLNAKGGLR